MISLIKLFRRKRKFLKHSDLTPKGISHTIVPKEFEAEFNVWDKPKNSKIIYV